MIPYHWSLMKKLIWLKKAVLSGAIWKTVTGSLIHITDALASPVNALSVNIDPVQSGSGDPSPDNVRPISGWTGVNVWIRPTHDTSADPSVSITFPTPPGTVYGGTLDVINGVLTVTHGMVDMGTLTWALTSRGFFQANLSGMKYSPDSSIPPDLICSKYKTEQGRKIYLGETDFAISTATSFSTIWARDSSYTDAATFKTSLSGVQMVYELITTQTYQLTASEVSTLLGENNIWADTGDTTVTYLGGG